ncbi:hypothetical protein [Paenibacillus sp. YN15]|uniref:hypothetical protein n=1 Tax=Paenibacillus sp. YN15 TaxID=1742774 RepID=UPI000DCCA7EA|nr:hypothetical protein [Paenibacillus sp. YN15]RAV04194.1 hypothetical protein DQG13_06875 [Paenibacillus sp. YN15]
MNNIAHTDYLRLLEPWVKPFREYCYSPAARQDLLCYGTGYNGWGMQTHQKAFAALAVLAADSRTDSSRTGMTREDMLDTALRMLRFTLESHLEGSYRCEDGTSWGHTWISVLGAERMMHGVEAIEEHLTAADRELLRKVLVSESNWLMDHYEVVGHPLNESRQNKPESNLWNGSMLHRTAALYPDTPRAEEYKEKGTRFLVNSISVASDALSSAVLDGRPVSEWFVGDNFFEESYALNHHGYLNVGYMVICLSNAAMLHFSFKRLGVAPPEALYHHVKELWDTVKPMLFPDGRLIRIGGDTRVRYCYCQDYLLPSLMLAADLFGDEDCPALEAGWLRQVETEMAANGDGTYLSARCADLKRASPLYYTRLESDRAVTLSYGAYWRRLFAGLSATGPKEGYKPAVPYAWEDAYHGACLVKGKRRIASWAWRAAEGPQGLCLPADGSDLAEWRYNLAGRIQGTGAFNSYQTESHGHRSFHGGFVTWGKALACSEELLAEQQSRDVLAVSQTAFAALPDDCTVVGLQYAKTVHRSYITSVRGLLLHVPNDVFNGSRRTYRYGETEAVLEGAGGAEQQMGRNLQDGRDQQIDTGSRWLNVDGKLGVVQAYGSAPLILHRPGRRQIGIKHRHQSDTLGMLYADEICSSFQDEMRDVPPDTVLVDTGFAVLAGCGPQETRELAEGGGCKAVAITAGAPVTAATTSVGGAAAATENALRAVTVQGADGQRYLLAANFGGGQAAAAVTLGGAAAGLRDLATLEEIGPFGGEFTLQLAPGEARLYVVKGPG